jgi:hypothetical protein
MPIQEFAPNARAKLSECGPGTGLGNFPPPGNADGLNGSMQHLLNVFIVGEYKADFVHAGQFKLKKALFRF